LEGSLEQTVRTKANTKIASNKTFGWQINASFDH
jgi:hypothetical protein